jgi:hypothetical protein
MTVGPNGENVYDASAALPTVTIPRMTDMTAIHNLALLIRFITTFREMLSLVPLQEGITSS